MVIFAIATLMSKQSSVKSRTEKGGNRNSIPNEKSGSIVPTPVITSDVVSGQLAFNEWTWLMQTEDDTSFVCSVVEDIVNLVLTNCYQNYILSQIIPYIVQRCKVSLIATIQGHFLARDNGEGDIDSGPGWKEDSEPGASVIDSWAQGAVPVVIRSHPPLLSLTNLLWKEGNTVPEIVISSAHGTDSQRNSSAGKLSLENASNSGLNSMGLSSNTFSLETESPFFDSAKKKKSTSYKKHVHCGGKNKMRNSSRRKVDKPEPIPHVETDIMAPEENINIKPDGNNLPRPQQFLQVPVEDLSAPKQANSHDGLEITAHHLKLHPPSSRVYVRYNIIDPEVEIKSRRLKVMRTGKTQPVKQSLGTSNRKSFSTSQTVSRFVASYKDKSMTATVEFLAKKTQDKMRHRLSEAYTNRRKQRDFRRLSRETRIYPLPPLLIDTISASPGVVIRQGDQVKEGPEESNSNKITHSGKQAQILRSCPLLHELNEKAFSGQLQPILDPADIVQDVVISNPVPCGLPLKSVPPLSQSRKSSKA